MLYAAALHNYISTMTNVIEDAELAVEYNLVMPAEMPALEVPDPPLVTTNIVTRKPIHFLDKEYRYKTLTCINAQHFKYE